MQHRYGPKDAAVGSHSLFEFFSQVAQFFANNQKLGWYTALAKTLEDEGFELCFQGKNWLDYVGVQRAAEVEDEPHPGEIFYWLFPGCDEGSQQGDSR